MRFTPTYEGPQTAFRGGPSGFIQGHYPVWYSGLPADYTGTGNMKTVINWYSRRAGLPVRQQLKHPRAAAQSGAQRLIKYFNNIIKNEREKEIAIIQTYLNNLKVHEENLSFETLKLAEEALKEGSLSTAYTWLQKYKADLKALKEELQNPKNKHTSDISHMNAFWHDEFDKFIISLFTAKSRDTTDSYIVDMGELTVEELVNAYIEHVLSSGNAAMTHNIESISDQMIKDLKEVLTKAGVDANTKDLFSKTSLNALALYRAQTKRGSSANNYKMATTTKGKIKDVATLLIQAAGRGMGQQLAVSARGSQHGSTIASDRLLKEYLEREGARQIKTDVFSYTVAEGTINTEQIVAPLVEAAATDSYAQYEKVRKEIKAQLMQLNAEIFEVAYNVKGYQSHYDWTVAKPGSFAIRTPELRALADTGVIPNSMFDKLVFLLYNTASGCILDGNTDFLKLYLGLACTVWFFDDWLDINIYSSGYQQSGINTVHIFAANGNYYTLSEILQNTANQLKEFIETGNIGDTLFEITITPPAINAAAEYQEAVSQNRNAMNAALSDKKNVNEDVIQDYLQQRWDYMRNQVASNGSLEIKAKQSRFEELLRMFEAYLRT